MNIEIRKMLPSDLVQVMKLLAQWNLAPVAPSLEVPVPERTEIIVDNTYVATIECDIIGVLSFIQISPTLAEGASLGVEPSYQSRGIADKLARAVRHEMYGRGVRTIRSESDRPEAIQWLLRRGHRIVGTVPKRHAFGSPDVTHWTVLEFDLDTIPELRDLSSE